MKFRVSAVQYQLKTIQSFKDFAKQCDHYINPLLNLIRTLLCFLSFLPLSYFQ